MMTTELIKKTKDDQRTSITLYNNKSMNAR